MRLLVREVHSKRLIEGEAGQAFMERGDDVGRVLEACFDNDVNRLLLYAENLPESFFDLSSGTAGTILQKLRTYDIRLAVVRSPCIQLSQRFNELLLDEQRGNDFRLFATQSDAQKWLIGE